MRILFDIVHPAHVHFYRFMIEELLDRGDEVLVVSRPKDVTTDLLDELGIPHQPIGSGPSAGRFGQATELVQRVTTIALTAREFRPDLICTRNPAGAIASRLLRQTRCLFDTDDGKQAGMVYNLAHPFATLTTVPDCLPERAARRHVAYPSYKSLAFTHPNRFTPDSGIRAELGVGNEPYFIVRLVALAAAHDHGEHGLPHSAAAAIVASLQARGRVFISSEGSLPSGFQALEFPAAKNRFHDALAYADLVVGDSVSVPIEGALLGTPGVFISSFAGRLQTLNELESRYQLVTQFQPADWQDARRTIEDKVDDIARLRLLAQASRAELLSTKVDLTAWYLDLISAEA